MAMLDRSEWYDIARTTNWTPRFVSESELFPPEQSDPFGIPIAEWETYDEPYKVSYREYVGVQREKDAGAYSVKAALVRSKYYEQIDEGYLSMLKFNYAASVPGEYAACFPEGRMARFSKAPSMRNLATFAILDELRHTQILLYFSHQLAALDRQFDWAAEGLGSMNWVSMAGRHAMEDLLHSRDIVTTSVMLHLAFETGLTNIQMLGLSADSANMGDYTFSNLITSIQSDEARHAQIGTPLVEIMVRNGRKAEAQKAMDVGFWRIWRLFALVAGIPMDYMIPLEKRERSFKEYVHEFVVNQFERQLRDLGLEKPWYWEYFLGDIERHHHTQQAGIWSWRATVWWHPDGAVGPKERAWLEQKYPGWNATYGKYWDVITENVKQGRPEKTSAVGMPCVCNMCNITVANRGGTEWEARVFQSEYKGRRYNFCSPVCQWIFDSEPEHYADYDSIVDRLYNGEIDPPTPENLLKFMGIGVLSDGGHDARNLAWAREKEMPTAVAAE
jgi:toluene monooxygenase system protein A